MATRVPMIMSDRDWARYQSWSPEEQEYADAEWDDLWEHFDTLDEVGKCDLAAEFFSATKGKPWEHCSPIPDEFKRRGYWLISEVVN